MDDPVGQGLGSKVKVMRPKNVHWDFPLTSESLPKKKLRSTTDMNMTWGVFKANAVSLIKSLYRKLEQILYPKVV